MASELRFAFSKFQTICFKLIRAPGQVDGEKNDKQTKRTARRMIAMTMEINKANFDGQNGNRTVPCYTRRRGSRQPLSKPSAPNAPSEVT